MFENWEMSSNRVHSRFGYAGVGLCPCMPCSARPALFSYRHMRMVLVVHYPLGAARTRQGDGGVEPPVLSAAVSRRGAVHAAGVGMPQSA